MSDLLNSASLVMIPSGYKEDVVYSQIPTDGSGDLSFTRASNGTRINSAGLVEVVPWNLLEQSETFDNTSAWNQVGGIVVTANTTTAPNGTTTADTLDDPTSGSFSSIQQFFVYVAGVYTYSIYIKKTSGSLTHYPGLEMCSKGSYLIFNTTTGTYVEEGGSNYTVNVANVGDYWRVSITTTTSGGSQNIGVWPAISTNGSSISSSATGSNVFWGAQLNIGSTAKPYFPTTDRLNVPRLTYQNGGGGCPSLLLEKQSTNVFTYSEQFDDASWVKFNSSISANTTTSPDGTSNADSLIENTGNTDHGFYKFAPTITTASGAVTISCFIKSNGRRVQIKNSYTTDASNFDLQNGVVVSNVGSGLGEIQNIGNGWYRCILKTTANASGNAGLTLSLLDNSNNMVYTGNGTSGVFVWGAQIEVSSYPTSYIPTTSSSATRVADACFKTGISSLIGQTEGVFYAEFTIPETESPSFFSISDGTSANRIIFGYYLGNLRYYTNSSSGGFSAIGVIDSSPVVGQVYKIAIAYKSNDFVVYKNGTNTNTLTTYTVPTSLTQMDNAGGGASQNIYASVKEILLFKTRLTNAELASLTTL